MKRATILAILFIGACLVTVHAGQTDNLTNFEHLMTIAKETGYARVILKLKVKDIFHLTRQSRQYKTVTPGSKFPADGFQADLELQQAIQGVGDSVLHRLNELDYSLNRRFDTIPYMALDVSVATLALLETDPQVLAVYEDRRKPLPLPVKETNGSAKLAGKDIPLLSTSTQLIGAKDVWDLGYTGTGWYVAILDTGIRNSHKFFDGKTIIEACYSAEGHCPNNGTSMTGTGAAAHHADIYNGHDHGTHVAGIAAGKSGSKAGVAKDSNIIAVNVFSHFTALECDSPSPCVASYDSDQIKGLEYIYSLRSSYSIAAANMSLGGGRFFAYCNDEPQKAAIDNLKAVRIATVIATGNEYHCDSVSSPACIESAVAVGASDDDDIDAAFNNWHPVLQELYAPGVAIFSATGSSDSSYSSWSGTSMATPHVTGAWALIRQASSGSTVDTIFNALRGTGTMVVGASQEDCNNVPIPRINIDQTVTELNGGNSGTEIIVLSRNQLTFSASRFGTTTGSQQVWIGNAGSGTMNWSTIVNQPWLTCTPTSGTNSGLLTVTVAADGLAAGTYSGTVNLSSIDASNTPQTISVNLKVIQAAQDSPPFGEFATPSAGSTLQGSIPITGWALDDIEIASVKIFNGALYVGDAVFVDGARPDVQQSYPQYPKNYQAGWGYMLLTHFLPNGGNGSYTLVAKATDSAGNLVILGSKTITLDNANAVKPFGAIDTPDQGGAASGSSFANWGWALTPLPNSIATDGSTINVWVDGQNLGHPTYNVFRSDIAALFPGYANSSGAVGYFYLDTTGYGNGLHTIQWTVKDNAGNMDGIGSRYFSIQNSGSPDQHRTDSTKDGAAGLYAKKSTITRSIKELQRLEVEIPGLAGSLSQMPVGSTVDIKQKSFLWQPGPGFVGLYEFAFLTIAENGEVWEQRLKVDILPFSVKSSENK